MSLNRARFLLAFPLAFPPAPPLALATMPSVPASGADKVPAPPGASTALPGVRLLPELLDMPGLNRKRQVRLYLPPGYATSGKRYPVLYMHDAQNLFDETTAFAGEWKVDETLDALAREGKLELIVVGIDNGADKRITELSAWDSARFGKAEGREYTDFIVKTLKPLIDARYRTLPGRLETAIMGSSMGGLGSHYAIAQYPQVFSKAGVFSPAYWVAPASFEFVGRHRLPKDARLYLLAGDKEDEAMVPDVQRMAGVVREGGHPEAGTVLKIVPGGGHNETFWSGELREALLWMFAPDGARQ